MTPTRNDNHPPKANTSRPEARGRFLKTANDNEPFVIYSRGEGGMLGWACVVSEPEMQPRSVLRLIALLILRNRELPAARRSVFGFPALAVEMIERELLARCREILGVRSWGSRRLVQGDSRASTVAVGAA